MPSNWFSIFRLPNSLFVYYSLNIVDLSSEVIHLQHIENTRSNRTINLNKCVKHLMKSIFSDQRIHEEKHISLEEEEFPEYSILDLKLM